MNDLDNVLFEIGNEGDVSSIPFQRDFIRLIKSYESGKPKQHPVGMTAVFKILDGSWAPDDGALLASTADWISPASNSYKGDPPPAEGTKVIIADVDHIWPAQPHQGWIWRCFLRGLNPILMDQYSYGNPKWTTVDEQEAMRRAMGDTLRYAKRMELAAMVPKGELSSSGYCLVNVGTEYLVYQPSAGEAFSVKLQPGTYRYEWFDVVKGKAAGSGDVSSAGGAQEFKPTVADATALYLKRVHSESD